ncbi:MAG: glycosyl hydrolase family 8 [Actinomycetota bacterium]|nr:glycosyl hydrolase family 8 [Actinomycetota bacterium]
MSTVQRSRWLIPAVAALLVVFVAAAYYLVRARAGDGHRGLHEPVPPGTDTLTQRETAAMATASVTHFLDTYVDPDGRVVRRDQGGDTVSEGQAYALLAAVAVGDRSRFERVWEWTSTHLERDDALLASHWDEGRIVDSQPAADADLDAARALLLAAERFQSDRYHDQAAELAAAILKWETGEVAGQRVLVAGPWAATNSPFTVNPSYFSPRGFGLLASGLNEPRWSEVRASSYRLIDGLTDTPPGLPPDWAQAEPSGEVRPIPAPGSNGRPQYGYDAVRVLIRMAADCQPRGQELAARPWPFLRDQIDAGLVDVYGLDGERIGEGPHPVAFVAAAAAAHAAGDRQASADLLARAEHLDRERPSYYGAAWVALGRVILTTDLLDECSAPLVGGKAVELSGSLWSTDLGASAAMAE